MTIFHVIKYGTPSGWNDAPEKAKNRFLNWPEEFPLGTKEYTNFIEVWKQILLELENDNISCN